MLTKQVTDQKSKLFEQLQQLQQNEKYCLVLHEKNIKLKEEIREL